MINYYLLTKPGIILGNLITFAAGFFLASKGTFHFEPFFAALLGLALVIASACVFNNYIDRHVDKKMVRTQNRVLVLGTITHNHALLFAGGLGCIGFLTLALFSTFLALLAAGIGFIVYVFIYSIWKRHTIHSTAIGSIAGAIPPIVGYAAFSNTFDLPALILFAMLILWQMPHFFSIAIFNLNDYQKANMPLLPIKKGIVRTKVHMLLYISAFIVASTLLTFFNFTGYTYFLTTSIIGAAWLILCLQGFYTSNNTLWGRNMFWASLVMICTISLLIPFDTQG